MFEITKSEQQVAFLQPTQSDGLVSCSLNMKKLLLLLSLFICFNVFGQPPIGDSLPVKQAVGNATNVQVLTNALTVRGGLQFGFFNDTTAANSSTSKARYYPNAFITTPVGTWRRNAAATGWIRIATTQDIISVTGCYTLLNGGIVTWSGTGFVMDVSPANYIIGCNLYSSPQSQVALAASDPSFDRIDVIYVNTSGQVGVLTGTPGATPAKPQVNPSSQLELTFITVEAGSTEPGGVTQLIIYDENLGSPSEWDYSDNFTTGSANPASTNNPFHLTINTVVANASDGSITFTGGSAVDISEYSTLKLYVRIDAAQAEGFAIATFLSNNGFSGASSLSLTDYGLNAAVIGSYQVITIPISAFAFAGVEFDGVNFKLSETSSTIHIDYVQLQGGIPSGNSPYLTNVFVRNDSLFQVRNGLEIFVYELTGGGGSYTFTNGLTESGGTVKLGGTLSEETTIDTDSNDLLINGTGNIEIGVINGGYLVFTRIGVADIGVTGMSRIYIADTLKINPFRSSLIIDSLNYTLSTTGKKIMLRDTVTGLVENIDPALIGSGGSPALSSITAATGMNIINNADYEQVWEWNSLTGNGLYLNSNSTTAESNQQTLFSAYMSGANANSTQTTYAASFANEHTGTASTNIAAVFNATNGTTNYAAQFRRGKTSFGTVGTESGILEINGSTSGTVTIQPAAVAGTPTLTLPTTTSTLVGDVVTQTLTNKRWVPRIGSTTSSATPTINTDNVDIYKLTAQAVDITDASTNLSGNPNDGDVFEVQITGTATRNINWGASFVSSTISLPTATNGTNTLTVIFQYYATSSYGNNKWVIANYY